HCADQASGGFGHVGRDSSHADGRIARYGTFGGCWGENISYGKSTARDVVLALIIDDGLPARKHRKNIFNPNFNFAGAAFGRHARIFSRIGWMEGSAFKRAGRITSRNSRRACLSLSRAARTAGSAIAF